MNSKEQIQSTPKKNNKTKLLLAATAISIAGAVNGQNAATIDPKNYQTPSNPFIIPNLPSGSDFFLKVKAGEKIYITLDGIDPNTATYYISDQTKTINGNIVELTGSDVGSILINYKRNGTNEVLSLMKNNQVDVYDRTTSSVTENTRPDIVWINPGQTANLNAGENMGYYRWKNMDESILSGGYTDSTKIVGKGQYISETRDKSGILPYGMTRDTIAVLEKPNINQGSKEMNFATTVEGISYFVSKYDENTQTYLPVTSFIGNGSPYTISNLENKTKYKVSAQRSASTEPDNNLPIMETSFTTYINDTEVSEKGFRQNNRNIYFDKDTLYTVYRIDGRLVTTGNANHFEIDQPGIYLLQIDKNTKAEKIIVK